MPLVDRRTNSVVLRIVYEGPPEAGKATNLQQLCERLSLRQPSPDDAAHERGMYLDWLDPAGGSVGGPRVRCQLVNVPRQLQLARRGRSILDSADAVVFVADSRASAAPRTKAALRSLVRGLSNRPDVPLVLQANKQDLPGAQPPSDLHHALGLAARVPVIAAHAAGGEGVVETFSLAVRVAVDHVRARLVAGELGEGDAINGNEPLLSLDAIPEIFDELDAVTTAADAATRRTPTRPLAVVIPEPPPFAGEPPAGTATTCACATNPTTQMRIDGATSGRTAISEGFDAPERTTTRDGVGAPERTAAAHGVPAAEQSVPERAAPPPRDLTWDVAAQTERTVIGEEIIVPERMATRVGIIAPERVAERRPAATPELESLGLDIDLAEWDRTPTETDVPPIAASERLERGAAGTASEKDAFGSPASIEEAVSMIEIVELGTTAGDVASAGQPTFLPLGTPGPPEAPPLQLPAFDLPAGLVWPGVSGRSALAQLAPPVHVTTEPASWAPGQAIEVLCGERWLAHTAATLWFRDLDDARRTLLETIRWQARMGALTPPGRTYALAPQIEGARLWILTPVHRTVWSAIEEAFAGGDRATAGWLARRGLETVDQIRAQGGAIGDLDHIGLDEPPRLLTTPWTPRSDRLTAQLQRLFTEAVL